MKFNWKYILVLVIISVAVGGWILIYAKSVEREIASLRFPEIVLPPKAEIVR